MRRRPQRLLGYGSLCDRVREHALDDPEPVLHPDGPPPIPAQYRRRVDQDDPLNVGCRTAIEEKPRTQPHRFQRVRRLIFHDLSRDVGDQVTFDLLVYRREQRRLVVELVIQRSPRNPGRGDDRLGGDVGKPLVGEQLPRGLDQQRPRRGGALGLCAPRRGLADHIVIDFHTGCT